MGLLDAWHGLTRRWKGGDRTPDTDDPDPSTSQAFLLRLGSALLSVGVATTDIQRTLRTVAAALGHRGASIIVLPTVMIVSVAEAKDRGLEAVPPLEGEVRFDRATDLYRLVLAAQRGELTAQEGLEQLDEVLARPPRFPATVRVIGHGIAASGVALVLLGADVNSMVAALIFGTLVGVAKLAVRAQARSTRLCFPSSSRSRLLSPSSSPRRHS